MTISTALYLDMNPTLAASGEEFDQAKFALLAATTDAVRIDYITRLEDPATNIDYVANYLACLQSAGKFDSPEKLLDAYNNNTWQDDPTAYGQQYGAVVKLLKDLGINFSPPSTSGSGGENSVPE